MSDNNRVTQTTPQALQQRPQLVSHWRYQVQQYGVAIAVAALFFIVISYYVFLRRGYYDLYIANKAFAGAAAILIGLVLLLGPLQRMFDRFDRYVQYRKELGVVSFFLIVFHGLVSFFFLPSHFPLIRFITYGLWPFIFALIATLACAFLFVISFERMRMKLGPTRWWWYQNWGVRIVFIFTVLHVGVMKWGSWVDWYAKGGASELVHPEWPGAGLLVAWFMLTVVVIRIAEVWDREWGRRAWYASVIGLPAVYVVTFIWGRLFI